MHKKGVERVIAAANSLLRTAYGFVVSGEYATILFSVELLAEEESSGFGNSV